MIENDVQIKLSDLNYSTIQNSADLIRDFHTALYGLKILFDEQPLIFLNFLPFTITAALPQLHTKPGKSVYIRLSGLRLH